MHDGLKLPFFLWGSYLMFFADWLTMEFAAKMEPLNWVTARCPKSFPHMQHHQVIVYLHHAVTTRLPALTVNVHFPILEFWNPELLASQTTVTQVTTRRLSRLWWFLFKNTRWQWIQFLSAIPGGIHLLIIFSWLWMSSHLSLIVSIQLEFWMLLFC